MPQIIISVLLATTTAKDIVVVVVIYVSHRSIHRPRAEKRQRKRKYIEGRQRGRQLLGCTKNTESRSLGAETVEGAALALEGVDDVERGDSLALGVLSVGDRVADDVLELQSVSELLLKRRCKAATHEGLEDTAGLLVDEARNTLDTTTASETADSGLGDTPREVLVLLDC